MKFTETALPGAYLIEMEPSCDKRGSFGRVFSAREFEARGLPRDLTEASISSNLYRGTLRGMHFQREPHGESKLVRAVRGAIFDVVLDLRSESPAFCKWVGFDLSDENGRALLVPRGCAHGFLTLADGTDVLYHITDTYEPSAVAGFAWDDPAFGIEWPFSPGVISESDKKWPPFLAP
jgi:dTDP-4-dehydrorhamnose 3,5-epimerase